MNLVRSIAFIFFSAIEKIRYGIWVLKGRKGKKPVPFISL